MKSLTNILSFIRVAECQSFVQAGATLKLSTSAISKGVARLEADLGVKLLHRTTRTLSLTSAGLRYYEGCRQLLMELQALEGDIRGEESQTGGRLLISAPVSLGRFCLLPLLREFGELHPELQVEVSFEGLLPAQKGPDVTICSGYVAPSSVVGTQQIGSFPLVVCGSPGYLDQRGRPFHPADLTRHSCLGCRNRSTNRLHPWSFSVKGKLQSVDVEGAMIFDDADALLRAAVGGIGLTQIPGYMAAESLAQGLLVEILGPYRPIEIPVTVCYLNRKFVPSRVESFLKFIVEHRSDFIGPCQAASPESRMEGELVETPAEPPDQPTDPL